MAKKKDVFSFTDLLGTVDGLIKKTSIIRETEETMQNISTISTGIYILNAALSSDIYGGIPSNRITCFGGESGSGKSFLCYNICREAQKKGQCVVYIDTEFSIQLDQLPGYGIDISEDKFMLLRTNVVEDLKIFITQLLDKMKEQKNEGKEVQKILFVLDSVGQLASRKEVEDAKSGKEKADMTRAKALASFFRIINSDLGMLDCALCCTNHTYESLDLFPKTILKGGNGLYYSASVIGFLTKAKLREGEIDEMDLNQSGIVVTIKMAKNRMAKPKKIKFELSFVSGSNPFSGLDHWCTEENFATVGIAKGKMDGKKFIPGGNRWYVRHLGTHVPTAELLTERVFNTEVLDALRPILKDYFRYRSITEIGEIQKQLEDSKTNIFDTEIDENASGSKLFADDED